MKRHQVRAALLMQTANFIEEDEPFAKSFDEQLVHESELASKVHL